jgi:PfaD family protein
MLAHTELSDVMMAPAADMFELGVEVQVLKRGTMFGVRAKKLYELYRQYASLDAIPASEQARLEKSFFHMPIKEAWQQTADYWASRDAHELDKANKNPKHQMALLFRSYLGQSSRWAITGEPSRKMDYQIWCGPAMGAFNAWTADTFLALPENREVVQVARNLMEGAAIATRAQQFRCYGVPIPAKAFHHIPRPLA